MLSCLSLPPLPSVSLSLPFPLSLYHILYTFPPLSTGFTTPSLLHTSYPTLFLSSIFSKRISLSEGCSGIALTLIRP
jgi:hypothetical protein